MDREEVGLTFGLFVIQSFGKPSPSGYNRLQYGF